MEVQRQEVGAGDEGEAVEETGSQASEVGTRGKYAQGHDRVFGLIVLNWEEESHHHDAKHDQADSCCGVPWEGHSTELETQEEHHSPAYHAKGSQPVNGFEASNDRGPRIVDVQEKE